MRRFKMKRVKTGVLGLDELVEGGIPEGMIIAVAGGPGTGKSIFCTQFLWQGLKDGEKVLYVTFDGEEIASSLKEQAKQFGMDLSNKNCRIISFSAEEADEVLAKIKELVKKEKYSRLILDSISMLNTYQGTPRIVAVRPADFETAEILRKKTRLNMSEVREIGPTTLVIVEDYEGSPTSDKVAEFAADGVIKLGINDAIGTRSMRLIKMRETKHPLKPLNIEIRANGIELLPTK